MRRLTAILAVAALVAATGALAVDTFIYGAVTGRVPGKNQARIAVRWEFKCLGDKLGEASYELTLVAVKLGSQPAEKITLREDVTSKKGQLTTTFAPGSWQLQADPFLCETERGAGSTAPEVGQTVRVPDYCSWLVTKARGAVELEQGAAVKRAKPGTVVAPGAAVVTRTGAALALASAGKDAAADLGASSRLAVDARQCASATGGWMLALQQGAVAVAAKPGSEATRPHVVATKNATSTAGAATWVVTAATKGGAPTTTVAVRSGSVIVKAGGKQVVVKAGFRTTVAGKGAPSKPTRG